MPNHRNAWTTIYKPFRYKFKWDYADHNPKEKHKNKEFFA